MPSSPHLASVPGIQAALYAAGPPTQGERGSGWQPSPRGSNSRSAVPSRRGWTGSAGRLSIPIASSLTSKLTQPNTLDLSTAQAASIGTLYLVGEVIGALVFGRMSDTLGRRKLFTWTLAIYLFGTALTALTPKGSGWIVYLYATRIIAGTGIGGEYSAINSAIA